MTRRGPPGHLTRPSRGAFFLAASENSCHCPLPKSQLASARRAKKPTLPNPPPPAPGPAPPPVSKPAVFLVEPWTIQPVQTRRQHLLPAMPISSALPIPTLPPPCLNQRCFVSVSPGRIFLAWLDSPSSSPCSSTNLRC